jgi:LuxR family maltose regulon positive regulatory protein
LRRSVLERVSDPAVRVAVMTAPGGYGKSSHAAALVAADERPAAWIDLETRHDDPEVLLADLMAALKSVTDIRAGAQLRPGASAGQDIAVLVSVLGRAVANCTDPFVLVLDDVHRLADPAANDLIGSIVSNVPAGSTVLLVGRACSIRAVARLRADSTTVDVGIDDLVLDAPAVAHVLTDLGLDPDADEVESLTAQAEGWPVGVRLGALVLHADSDATLPDPPTVSGRVSSIADYVDAEWLSILTEDERELLSAVSPLEWISGPLCNHVLDRQDAGAVLHNIFRNRLLLIPLDRRGDAYRMHALLREALEADLERTDPVGARRVHERASTWFEDAGDIDRAVRHAIEAQDLRRAGQLVVLHGPALYTNGRYSTLGRWLAALPDEQVAADPALCLCAALAALGLGNSDTLPIWLRLGEHAAATAPDVDPVVGLCLQNLRSTTSLGPVRPALDAAAGAHGGLPPGIWHAASCLSYGGWSWIAGEETALDVLAEGAEEAAVLGAPAMEAYCCALIAFIAFTEGDRARSSQMAARARRVALDHELEGSPGMALVSAMHALASVSAGDAQTGRVHWQVARNQLARVKVISGWANVQTRLVLAHTAIQIGDGAGADRMIREAREYLVQQPDAVRALQQIALLEQLLADAPRRSSTGASTLTTAELRVLHYLPTHFSLGEIAERLYVSRYTVKTHCGSIYRKLGVTSRSDAVDAARRSGLLDPEEHAEVP